MTETAAFAEPNGETPADIAAAWKQFFRTWPEGIPRTGVLITSFAEQIPFCGFMTSEQMVLVDRRAPDTLGARRVVVPYAHVAGVKYVDVFKDKLLRLQGFEGPVSKNSAE
jgi:hypothetical protein